MSNTAPIQVPDIGDFDTVEVIEVLVKSVMSSKLSKA